MTSEEPQKTNPGRAYSLASQIVFELVSLPLLGAWLDKKYGWSPWGVFTGAVLGLVLVITNLARRSD